MFPGIPLFNALKAPCEMLNQKGLALSIARIKIVLRVFGSVRFTHVPQALELELLTIYVPPIYGKWGRSPKYGYLWARLEQVTFLVL
jgi:hypothetical protein